MVPTLSVVVPCFNEEAVVDQLVTTLVDKLTTVTDSFEVVLVDDGSTDRTLHRIRAAAAADGRIRYVSFSRNFGKESAMLAGLRAARGQAVAILDADLQHPPEKLAEMLPLLDEGYDQVVARRTREGDPAVRTALSRAYYSLFNRLVDVQLIDGAGDFRILSRRAVDALLSLPEYDRFSKGLFAWVGFPTTYVEYRNVARAAGDSKWRLRSLMDYGIDGVLSFNTRPLRLAIHLGAAFVLLSIAYTVWVVVQALINGVDAPGYVTTLCVIVGMGGVQMMMVGVLGEYVGRIYSEAKRRPHYVVLESSESPR